MTLARATAWILRLALAGVAVAIIVVALTGCTLLGTSMQGPGPTDATDSPALEAIPVDAVSLVEYRVYQALPDLDDSMRTTDDPEHIRQLVDLLNQRPEPGGYDSDDHGVGECPPGSSTAYVAVTLTSGEQREFGIDGCDENEWAQQLHDLVWSWAREEGL